MNYLISAIIIILIIIHGLSNNILKIDNTTVLLLLILIFLPYSPSIIRVKFLGLEIEKVSTSQAVPLSKNFLSKIGSFIIYLLYKLFKSKVAIISYKIASTLPNSVAFNFLEEFKVWFWIANHEPKKYLAYINIYFITDNLKKEATSNYYNGTLFWKLNAYSGIQAPGLGFPGEIKTTAKQGGIIKIEIHCRVHDEFDKFIEEKLPQIYVYDPKKNSWFLEP